MKRGLSVAIFLLWLDASGGDHFFTLSSLLLSEVFLDFLVLVGLASVI
jgi:hypothetical protein